jgi:hypothetical protein
MFVLFLVTCPNVAIRSGNGVDNGINSRRRDELENTNGFQDHPCKSSPRCRCQVRPERKTHSRESQINVAKSGGFEPENRHGSALASCGGSIRALEP